jgi:hypothetical protein
VALTKRDVFFFLERLCEQTNCVLKYQYKKRFGFFRNFKVKGGNVRLTSYVLQSITSPAGASYSVCVYNLIGQALCNYCIGPLPFLSLDYNVNPLNSLNSNQYPSISQGLVYNVNKLNALNSNQYPSISQGLVYNVNKLNTQSNSCMEGLSCLVNYTITKQ